MEEGPLWETELVNLPSTPTLSGVGREYWEGSLATEPFPGIGGRFGVHSPLSFPGLSVPV